MPATGISLSGCKYKGSNVWGRVKSIYFQVAPVDSQQSGNNESSQFVREN
jgi:hypothetical protein